MKIHSLRSDQLYTWSDENRERAHCRIAKTPQLSSSPTASSQSDPSRLPHRALQTMWQAGMQMRRRSRSWPQVLSFGELSGLAAANGLRAPGGLRANGGVPRQLPSNPRDLREDLRDQPRTSAPPRGALTGGYEQGAFCPLRTDRYKIGWRAPRQYDCRLARRQPKGFAICGDHR
jgi:hypothetical protein